MADVVQIKNPARAIIPATISALTLVMFLPPLVILAFQSNESAKAITGCVGVLMAAGAFAWSAWRAPVAAMIPRATNELIVIRKIMKESRYSLSEVRKWFFAIPNGLPTQEVPNTNAMLHLTLSDRTQFRGEVTAQEAAIVAATLGHVVNANVRVV